MPAQPSQAIRASLLTQDAAYAWRLPRQSGVVIPIKGTFAAACDAVDLPAEDLEFFKLMMGQPRPLNLVKVGSA